MAKTTKNPESKDALKTKASFPALLITQNKHRFYFTTIPVSDLFPYCFVVRRDEEPVKGFQRTLNEDRATDIARYLDDALGSIPTNIVLSAQTEADLQYDRASKTVKYTRSPRAFLVLDGQHRLYGYSMTKKPHRVPVAIYEGLDRRDEATLFIDINTNQRGVPAALLLDIKQVAEKESFSEAKLRQWFDRLNGDPQSPLNGFLSPSQSSAGKISRVTFNRGVILVLQNPVMERLPEDKQYQLLRNYFSSLESAINDKIFLRRSAYFEAFCEIFDDVMRLSKANHQNYKPEALTAVLGSLASVDLANIPTKGRSYVTKTAIVPILKQALAGQIDVTEDMV